VKTITYRNWDVRAKRLQNKCLRLFKRSLTTATILNRLHSAITEVYIDDKIIFYDEEKYKEIREEVIKEAQKGWIKLPNHTGKPEAL